MNCNCRGGPTCCRFQPVATTDYDDPGLRLWVALKYILIGDDGTVVVPPPPVMPTEGVTPLVLHDLGDR